MPAGRLVRTGKGTMVRRKSNKPGTGKDFGPGKPGRLSKPGAKGKGAIRNNKTRGSSWY